MMTATTSDTPQQEGSIPIGMLLCAVAILFNMVLLLPELDSVTPMLHDGALHLAVLEKTVDAIGTGQDLTDLWIPNNLLGYPLFHHYQHLGYVLPALVYWPLRDTLPLPAFFHGMIYLLLSLFPLAVYRGMRLMGFEDLAAGFGALGAPLIASNTNFGLEFGSYIWAGHGLYTQLWGMFLMPLAIGHATRLLREGRGLFPATLLTGMTVLFSLPIGYVTLGSICLIGLTIPFEAAGEDPLKKRLLRGATRLGLLLGLVFAITAYFIVPFVRDSAYMNRSVWYGWENDSGGFAGVMTDLLKGDFFDFGRGPFASLLVLGGLLAVINRWEKRPLRLGLILFVLWLGLAFGRETWGPLYDLLPMGRDMQLGRLITGIHFGGILLIGAGLSEGWGWLAGRRNRWLIGAGAALTLGLIVPAALNRAAVMKQSASWMAETRAAYESERADIEALVGAIEALPPGRVYAGKTANWGGEYRVGWVPMNAILTTAGVDTAGYSFHSWPLVVDIQLLMDEAWQPHYDLLNIRYLVMPEEVNPPTFASEVGHFGRHVLYLVETSGFFTTGTSPLAFSGGKYDFFTPTSTWFMSVLPATGMYPAVYLDDSPGVALPLEQGDTILSQWQPTRKEPPGTILSESIGDEGYQADVSFTREGILVLKANYHPGLRATIDGEEAELFMVMPGFSALRLGTGEHDVAVTYQPGGLRTVWLIGGIAVACAFAFLQKKLRP